MCNILQQPQVYCSSIMSGGKTYKIHLGHWRFNRRIVFIATLWTETKLKYSVKQNHEYVNMMKAIHLLHHQHSCQTLPTRRKPPLTFSQHHYSAADVFVHSLKAESVHTHVIRLAESHFVALSKSVIYLSNRDRSMSNMTWKFHGWVTYYFGRRVMASPAGC